MNTVFFVHGTGTREPHYSLMLEKVRVALQDYASVEKCYWGQTEGSSLNAGGASIPSYNSTRSVAESYRTVKPETEDFELALWELLLEDPLIELRLLSSEQIAADASSPNRAPQRLSFDVLSSWETTLPTESELRAVIQAARVGRFLAQASDDVADSDAYLEASQHGERADLCGAAARAIVALAFLLADESEAPIPARTDPELRDKLVDAFFQILDGAEIPVIVTRRGFDRLLRPLTGLAAKAASNVVSNYVRRRRGAVHDATTAAAGDVLLYQARGEGIRDFIRRCIMSAPGPTTLLAHSLGGIACADLLILERIPQVKLLITLGSQAPFFYEINALQSMKYEDSPPHQRLPAGFPPWLNFYDLRDFLSYVCQPVFGSGHITDVRVDNRLPFPDSHGGYFSNAEVWRHVIEALVTMPS